MESSKDTVPPDSPAALASLAALREILIVLRDRGVLSSNEIVNSLNRVDPGITAKGDFDQLLYRAYLWLKTPFLVESVVQTSEEITRSTGFSRLGEVLNWIGIGLAVMAALFVVVCCMAIFGVFGPDPDNGAIFFFALIGAVLGLVTWMSGRAAKYILAGR